MVLALATTALAQDAPVEPQVRPAVEPPSAPTDTTAPQPDAENAQPIAKVDAAAHDFGTVWDNEQLKHAFQITNVGGAVLKILKVKPACGCTVADKYPPEIAPGESGAFSFRLNTGRLHGKFTKTIAITTNDPKNQQIRLSLTGAVKHHVEMSPQIAQFGRVNPDSVLTRTVKITNNSDQPLELNVNKDADLGCFKAELEELKAGQEFELTITAAPPFKTGINRATINLTSNVPSQKKLDVVCMATLPQRLELQPKNIQLIPAAQAPTARRIALTNNGPTPVNILAALAVGGSGATDETVEVSTKEVEPGKRYSFTVSFPAGYEPASADAAIVLKTDDAESPELRVPVQVIDRRPPQRRPQERPAMTLLGKPASQETAKTALDGAEIRVGGKGDQVQFLVFYASWCGFCKRALPKIEALQQQYKDNKDVEIIAINLDDRSGPRARTEEQTLQHYKDTKLTMPLVMDSSKKIGREYKVTSFPTMFLVGKSGDIEAVHVGAAAGFEKTVATEIDLLAAGKTRADFPAVATATLPRPVRAATRLVNQPSVDSAGEIPVQKATVRRVNPAGVGGDGGAVEAAEAEETPQEPTNN